MELVEYKKKVEKRLLKKLKRDDDGCLIWQRKHESRCRPLMSVTFGGTSRLHYAHRVAAWLWLDFDLDSPFKVLHKCDKRLCCNPNCLYVGTLKDNSRDALVRGRLPQVKLSKETARAILADHEAGIRGVDIARKYGTSKATVSRIIRRRSYKYI